MDNVDAEIVQLTNDEQLLPEVVRTTAEIEESSSETSGEDLYHEPWEIIPDTQHQAVYYCELGKAMKLYLANEEASLDVATNDLCADLHYISCLPQDTDNLGSQAKDIFVSCFSSYTFTIDETLQRQKCEPFLWLKVMLPSNARTQHKIEIQFGNQVYIWRLKQSIAPPLIWQWQKCPKSFKVPLSEGQTFKLKLAHLSYDIKVCSLFFSTDKYSYPPGFVEFLPDPLQYFPQKHISTYNSSKPWTAFRVADDLEVKTSLEERIEYVLSNVKHRSPVIKSPTIFVKDNSEKIRCTILESESEEEEDCKVEEIEKEKAEQEPEKDLEEEEFINIFEKEQEVVNKMFTMKRRYLTSSIDEPELFETQESSALSQLMKLKDRKNISYEPTSGDTNDEKILEAFQII